MTDYGSSGTAIIKMASDDFDITKLDLSELFGVKVNYGNSSNTWVLEFVNNEIIILDRNSYSITWDAENATMYVYANFGSMVTFDSFNSIVKFFEDFVVNDDETAYPDDGAQDGYWYERVVEGIPVDEAVTAELLGCSKIAIDKYTPSSNVAFNNIPHSLGQVPSLVIVTASEIASLNNAVWRMYHCDNINGGSWYSSGTDKPCLQIYYSNSYKKYRAEQDNITKTASTITASGLYLGAGIEYTIITGV